MEFKPKLFSLTINHEINIKDKKRSDLDDKTATVH